MKTFSINTDNYYKNGPQIFGYSYAYSQIEKWIGKYLNEIGVELKIDDENSRTQLYFGEPKGGFYPNQYKIQMTQWESTKVPPHWKDSLSSCDELWTANFFGRQAFINSGVAESKIYIFEHGVDSSIWTPLMRGQRDKVRFLHIDSGSPRKRADLAKAAFKKAFGNNPNYELTLKYTHFGKNNTDWSDVETLATAGEWETKNIRNIKEDMSEIDLVKLYHYHDVLVYPSEGEGFGMIPLQALATGMPVISSALWSSYEQYFNGNVIESTLGPITVKENYERFGDVIVPSLDSLVNIMLDVSKNIEGQSKLFFPQHEEVVKKYNWYDLSKKAIDGLILRRGPLAFAKNKRHLR
jgi:glycosyltransferase involved in cell wall biosynthesis